MRRPILLLFLVLTVLPAFAAEPKQDAAGCKDDPLFPVRMPNYRIGKCEHKAFASYDFFTANPRQKKTVEGELTFITYVVDARESERSGVEVVRNYENALRKIGGKVHAIDPDWRVNGSVVAAGKEAWVEAQKGNGTIWLRIVRVKAMEQTIVAAAAALAGDLEATGHATVHGIYFDTAKADLKPESEQAVAQIAAMLKANAALKVFVVGHTDTVGSVDANLKLSQARAESVIAALARSGIAAARLRAFGNGPFAPVASNASEEGRAQNRRVELVKQ